jgi:hypothetical protein
MEAPAIISGVWIYRRKAVRLPDDPPENSAQLWREVFLNGSIVVLAGSLIVGLLSGTKGKAELAPFVDQPFKGILCLFLLEMGLVTARRLLSGRSLTVPIVAFGLYMPIIGASLGLGAAWLCGLDPGSAALLATLCASASYIAVPAAMSLAIPEANAAVPITLALGITFPFNLALGIPLYTALAQWLFAP